MSAAIGFIGLGVLGAAIAQNLVQGGSKVLGYDIAPQARAAAQKSGVQLVGTPADLCEAAPVVFTCLPGNDALLKVMEGPDGLLSQPAPGQIIVDLSTLSLAHKHAFAKICEAAGRIPIDCPVSGNRILALKKKLTAFCSGNEAVFDRLKPVLEQTCSKAHYVGEFGNGSKIKICGNILNLVHNTVAAEAMVLAMKSGIEPALFHEVISGSGSSSGMFETRGAMMVDEDYQREGMNMSVPLKDARIISEHAAELLCPLPLYQAALQHYYAAAAQGLDNRDAAVVCKVMETSAAASRVLATLPPKGGADQS